MLITITVYLRTLCMLFSLLHLLVSLLHFFTFFRLRGKQSVLLNTVTLADNFNPYLVFNSSDELQRGLLQQSPQRFERFFVDDVSVRKNIQLAYPSLPIISKYSP